MRVATLINLTRGLLLLVGAIMLIASAKTALSTRSQLEFGGATAVPARWGARDRPLVACISVRTCRDRCAGCASGSFAARHSKTRRALAAPHGATANRAPGAGRGLVRGAMTLTPGTPQGATVVQASVQASERASLATALDPAPAPLHSCRMRISSDGLRKLRLVLGEMLPDPLHRGGGEVEFKARGRRLGRLCMPLEGAKLARLGDRLERNGISRDVVKPSDVVDTGDDVVIVPDSAAGGALAVLLSAVEDRDSTAPASLAVLSATGFRGGTAGSRRQVVESL